MSEIPLCSVRGCGCRAWAVSFRVATASGEHKRWRLLSDRCERHEKQRAPPKAIAVDEFDAAALV